MKRVLVTGAGGSIGSELVRQLAKTRQVYCLDNNETATYDLVEELKQKGYEVYGRIGDIRDKATVEDVFEDWKPHEVYHAAAYKVVPAMEYVPLEAINVNCLGAWNVIAAAKKWEAKKFVFISSDKAVNSNSVMGMTKKLGETLVRNQGKGFIVVRFGNVMGSRGSVLPLWENQMNRGEPLTVTDERMERYFMSIPQAVSLVIKAAEIGKGGEIICLDMGRKVNIMELAENILKEAKSDVGIRTIGLRPGETLSEKLMTEEEEKRATKEGNYWIIRP